MSKHNKNIRKRNQRRQVFKTAVIQAERDAHNPAGSKLLRRWAGLHPDRGTKMTYNEALNVT